MEFAIQVCSYIVGIPLEILAISAILRGGLRRYPLVFVYVVAVFLTTVTEMPTSLAYYSGGRDPAMEERMLSHYWRNEGILQVIIFALVISLIYSATSRLAARRIVRLALVAGATLFVGISFLLHYDANVRIGLWMTPWTMYLKFCSAILDLALWAILIRSREKNRTLLILSGGLGIMFAGGTIGEAVRNLASPTRSHIMNIVGGVIVITADLVLLYILWQAFRKSPPALRKTRSQVS